MRAAGWHVTLGLVVAVAAAGAPARSAADKKPTFAQRVKEAQAQYQQGNYARAVEELNAAYALRKEPRLLFNLGHAYARLGDPAASLRSFTEFLRRERGVPTQLRADIEHLMDVQREKLAAPAAAANPATPSITAGAQPQPAEEEPALAAVQRKHQWLWRRKGAIGGESRGTKYLLGVWGAGDSTLWAVGSGGTILR